MRVLISGSSGLIGGALARRLAGSGAEVIPFVRREGLPGVFWQPEGGRFDAAGAEGADAVIHLAGEGVASGRWNERRKRRIHQSRATGTRVLAEGLAALRRPPKVFAVASGIGYYGDAKETPQTESSAPGEGFLAKVCVDWEAACGAARERMRVVTVRIGIVLSRQGGALAQMLPIFRLGLGGRIGDGRQWMSWIALEDLLRIFEWVITDESIAGPVNAASPNPVRNEEFARTLASVLRRPAVMPVPAFAARMMLGAEMADELLLGGAQVMPRVLTERAFQFSYPRLEEALHAALGA